MAYIRKKIENVVQSQLDHETYVKLVKFAMENDRSVSWVVAKLLRRFIENIDGLRKS